MESKKRTILYSVKQGDNLYKISELFDVSVKSIKDINKFKEETLRPGQIIKIAIKAFQLSEVFGSRASLRPSPKKLRANKVIVKVIPG